MECFKYCLMGHTGKSMDHLNCDSLAQQVPAGKNFSLLPRDRSCDILVKNVASFWPCKKCLPQDKVRRFRLI